MSPSVPAATAVLAGTPKAGHVDEINAVASFVGDIVNDCAQYHLSVSGAARELYGAKSIGVTRIQEKLLDRLMPGADMLSASASQSKKALNHYAAEVERIHRRADRIKQDVREDLQSISSAMSEIERIAREIRFSVSYSWQTVPPGQLPDQVLSRAAGDLSVAEQSAAKQNLRMLYENQWLGAAVRWKMALEHIDGLKAEWSRLIQERKIVEKVLSEALSDTVIGHMISLGSGAGTSAKRTIALVVSGELWGEPDVAIPYRTSHPLLKKLIDTEDGSDFQNLSLGPDEIAFKWAELTPEEQKILIAAVPGVIGNLPGLSGEVRDAANRVQMAFFRAHPQMLSLEQLRLAAGLQDILTREATELLENGRADPPIQLLGLNIRVEVPKAAIAYGNVDTNGFLTWVVPGMLNDASEGMLSLDFVSRNIYFEQNRVALANENAAVIAWLGYDTPGNPIQGDLGVLSSKAAILGAKQLVAEINGFDASRMHASGQLPSRSVGAHSYGTTTASIAMLSVTHPVDSFIMVGSAGLDTTLVESLDQLNVKEVSPGQKAIYTTNAERDHLAPLGAGASGRGQPNPSADAFGIENNSSVYEGAFSYSSEGDASKNLKGTDGHSLSGAGSANMLGDHASEGRGYFDSKTQSLNVFAKISMNQIDSELFDSFVVTGVERIEYRFDRETGAMYPVRVKDDK